jgi:hypothetical protein
MELKPCKSTNFKVIRPSNVADSDENYAVMASFNQVYALIKVSKQGSEIICSQIFKTATIIHIMFSTES